MTKPTQKVVSLSDASCLKADRSNLSVSVIQPQGRLYISDELGPHYHDSDKDDADSRTRAFLNLVQNEKTSLAISPEYFTPISAIQKILKDPKALRADCLYVLPIESLLLDQFDALIQEGNKRYDCEHTELDQKSGKSVNPCAILYRNNDQMKLFLQVKIFESDPEYRNLKPGKEFFVVEGQDMALIVLLCSDANYAPFHEIWTASASTKPGAYIIHAQCNRSPDFENYRSFWNSIFNHELGPNRLVFSLNWGIGTEVVTEEGMKFKIPRSRSRIMRGKISIMESYYPKRSAAGIHLQQVDCGSRNKREVWHIIPGTEHCQVLEMNRPFENLDASLVSRRDGVAVCSYYERSEKGDQFVKTTLPTGLTRKFWKKCEVFGVGSDDYDHFEGLSLCELERLCYSILIRGKDSWLKEDVDERIPTVALVCNCENPKSCNDNTLRCYNRENGWTTDQEYVCRCLRVFYMSSFRAEENLNVLPGRIYPFNLVDDSKNPVGWLFHGQGKTARNLEKKIEIILSEIKIEYIRKQIFICPFGVDGSIKSEKMFEKPADVTDPRDDSQHSVTRAIRGFEINVKEITDRDE